MVLLYTKLNYVSAFLLLAFTQPGGCLSCYVCDSDRDPDCGDPFANNEEYLMDCEQFANITGTPLEDPVCYKAQDKVEYMGVTSEGIERGCSERRACEDYEERAAKYFYKEVLCMACAGDYCNGSIIYYRIR